MSTDLKRLLVSEHPVDRAAAGRRLASLAGRPDVDSLLHGLLLHDENTLLPFETAEALSKRRDSAGMRVLAKALGEADPRDLQFHWILDAVGNVWMQTLEDAATAQRLCSALIDDADNSVRTGARELLDFSRPTSASR
jgi:DNA transposition AAA+ family ATPase